MYACPFLGRGPEHLTGLHCLISRGEKPMGILSYFGVIRKVGFVKGL